MPVSFLTEKRREQLNRFPEDITSEDIITYFTFSSTDISLITKQRGDYNRLGFGLQLCALRYLGFAPDDFTIAPKSTIDYVAKQLKVSSDTLKEYGSRPFTRTIHFQEIQKYLGFRKANQTDLTRLASWLLDRALEHDKPSLLFQLACEKMQQEKIVRPGVSTLERMVATARNLAQQETYNRLKPLMTKVCCAFLDTLLVSDIDSGRTPLSWLRIGATSNTAPAILAQLAKLAFLYQHGVCDISVCALNPNRVKFLAQLGRKSTSQALQRAPVERRYPILLAFLNQSLIDISDELMEMYDRCLWDCYTGARHDLETFKKEAYSSANEKVMQLQEVGKMVLDPTITDEELRKAIFAYLPLETLQSIIAECQTIVRPIHDHYFDFLAKRYNYLRQFVPDFLSTFVFRSNRKNDPLLAAIDILKQLNVNKQRKLPSNVPRDFLPSDWIKYVIGRDGKVDRRYYELCVLWELRAGLRSGNIYLSQSRRYANPETYLIPPTQWPQLRQEMCREMQAPEDGNIRMREREKKLEKLVAQVSAQLAKNGEVRMEEGRLVVSKLSAEEVPARVTKLQQLITERLPRVALSDVLIELDHWTHWSSHLKHLSGNEPRNNELLIYLYASVFAQACNFGFNQFSQSADLSPDRLAWYTNWYIREETLKDAFSAIVNFQYHQPLSLYWGSGTISSSDGQRFPVSVKTKNATALPRYFGYGRGLTFYTWTSDQFSQYGSKIIPTTVRDATYVLDAILDNETELAIIEHMTDTAGYTELIFALFDLLGLRFTPRLRDLSDQQLYRMKGMIIPSNLKPLFTATIHSGMFLNHWDNLLRIAGSLKKGWVTASLLISKLQAYPQQNILTQALQEYGRLVKTIFILSYLENKEDRRHINAQLNKGESIHSLRQAILYANEGKIRKSQEESQTNQVLCLNLMTNAVIAWNPVYMQAVIDQLKREGYQINEDDLRHISPARYEHINLYGKFSFNVDQEFGTDKLRPLRTP